MRGVKRFLGKLQNLVALMIVGLFISIALAAPYLSPVTQQGGSSNLLEVEILKSRVPLPPGKEAILGTVPTGILGGQYDVYHTLVWGTRSALRFGFLVALGTALLGVMIGALGAYFGGRWNSLAMRWTDAFLAFPIIDGVVLFQQLLSMTSPDPWTMRGQPTPLQVLINQVDPLWFALILFSWMPYARITNSLVLRVSRQEFVLASKSLGSGHLRILTHHIVPNSISPAIVLLMRDIGAIVVLQVTLTFIGVASGSDWGSLLVAGRRWIIGPGGNPLVYWWVFIPVTFALVLFGIGWNLLGDGLNDWLNVRRS